MPKNKLILIFVIVAAVALGFIFGNSPGNPTPQKLQVTTSFYPLYFFTGEIAKDMAKVINITPAGAEPHDYEPTTQDIANMENSALLIINGGSLETWGDKVKDNLKKKDVLIVSAAEGLDALNEDPHVWLDPQLAILEVRKIAKAMETIDPVNKTVYESNAFSLEKRLEVLDESFRQGLSRCRQKDIVTSHTAFGYIAARYGFKQVSIAGLTPDEEPSPRQLAEVANFAKANNLKFIFFETLLSSRLSETIATEIGAKTLVFNPLEGLTPEEENKGEDYFSVQMRNLANLKIALECQ